MAGNKRDDGGNGQLCALAFDSGNGRQQQRWQWRMKTAFNGGSNGQLQGGSETTVQWTTTAVAGATTVTVADDDNNGCGCDGNGNNNGNGCDKSDSGRHRQQSTLAAEETVVVELTVAMTMMAMAAAAATTMVTAAMKGQPNRHSTLLEYEDGNYKLG
jgi:hypothetical protein